MQTTNYWTVDWVQKANYWTVDWVQTANYWTIDWVQTEHVQTKKKQTYANMEEAHFGAVWGHLGAALISLGRFWGHVGVIMH